jgi:hypothetical protein
MADDNQQQVAYNKAVQDQQMAYRLFNNARYNQQNPYLSQQTPAVQRYYNYYQNKDELKIAEENKQFEFQVQREQKRLGTTTGPLTKQQVSSFKETEKQFFQSKGPTKTITPMQQQIMQGPSQASSFDFTQFNKQSNVLKSGGSGSFTAAVNVGNNQMQDYVFGYKGSQVTSAKGLGTPMDIFSMQPRINLNNGNKPSLQQFMQPSRNSLISAFNEGPRQTKNITPIGQNVIGGGSSPVSININSGITPLPTSDRNSFLEFIKPPTTALTPVIQEAFANQRMAESLGLKFYNTKTPLQSVYSFVNPKGYQDLSYSQQIENEKTLQTVRQANINLGRIEQQFKTDPLSLQGFKGFESKTTKEGEVISFNPQSDYLSNFFTFDTKTYGKTARQNYFNRGFLNVVPGIVAESEMALFKTGFNVASGFHKFESAAFNLPYKETTTGYVAEVRRTPTNPLIQIPLDVGAIGYLSSDLITSAKGNFQSLGFQKGLVETGSRLSPIQFNANPTFRIEDIYGADKTTLKAIEVYQPGKITRIFPEQKGDTLFGSTKFKGYESIDVNKGIARGKFDFTFPETKFVGGEFVSNMKTIQLETTGYGFNINQRDANNIDINFQSSKGISARQDLSVREFRLMSGDYKEYDLTSIGTITKKNFGFIQYTSSEPAININIKTKIEGFKLYDNSGTLKSFDIQGIQRNVEYPSNLITSQQTKGFQSMTTLNLLSTQRSPVDFSQTLSQQSFTGTTRMFSGGSQSQQNKVVSGLSFRQVSSPQQYSFDITNQGNTNLFPPIDRTKTSSRDRNRYGQIPFPNQDIFQLPKTNQVTVQQPVSDTKQRSNLKFGFENVTGFTSTGIGVFSGFGGFGGMGGFGSPKSLGGIGGFGMKNKGFSYRNIKPSFTAVALNLKGSFPKSMSIGNMNFGISPGELRLLPGGRSGRKGKKSKASKKSSPRKSTSKRSSKKRR